MREWQEAQTLFERCVSICWRSDAARADRLLVERRHVRRRRRRRRAEDVLQDVLAANHHRRARRIAGHRQHAAVAEHAAALLRGEIDAAELGPGHAVDAVVLGQELVEEGVARVEKLADRAVLAQHAQSKNIRVSVFIASRSSGLQAGNFCGSGLMLSRLRISSHWPAKFSAIAKAFGSASMRLTWASSTAGAPQAPPLGQRQQLVVRHRVPQEVAQPRGQLHVGDRDGPWSDRSASRSRSMWNRKCGETSMAWIASAIPCSVVWPSALASATNFLSAATSARVDRAPVGAARQRREDPVDAQRRRSSGRKSGSSCGWASLPSTANGPTNGDRADPLVFLVLVETLLRAGS